MGLPMLPKGPVGKHLEKAAKRLPRKTACDVLAIDFNSITHQALVRARRQLSASVKGLAARGLTEASPLHELGDHEPDWGVGLSTVPSVWRDARELFAPDTPLVSVMHAALTVHGSLHLLVKKLRDFPAKKVGVFLDGPPPLGRLRLMSSRRRSYKVNSWTLPKAVVTPGTPLSNLLDLQLKRRTDVLGAGSDACQVDESLSLLEMIDYVKYTSSPGEGELKLFQWVDQTLGLSESGGPTKKRKKRGATRRKRAVIFSVDSDALLFGRTLARRHDNTDVLVTRPRDSTSANHLNSFVIDPRLSRRATILWVIMSGNDTVPIFQSTCSRQVDPAVLRNALLKVGSPLEADDGSIDAEKMLGVVDFVLAEETRQTHLHSSAAPPEHAGNSAQDDEAALHYFQGLAMVVHMFDTLRDPRWDYVSRGLAPALPVLKSFLERRSDPIPVPPPDTGDLPLSAEETVVLVTPPWSQVLCFPPDTLRKVQASDELRAHIQKGHCDRCQEIQIRIKWLEVMRKKLQKAVDSKQLQVILQEMRASPCKWVTELPDFDGTVGTTAEEAMATQNRWEEAIGQADDQMRDTFSRHKKDAHSKVDQVPGSDLSDKLHVNETRRLLDIDASLRSLSELKAKLGLAAQAHEKA